METALFYSDYGTYFREAYEQRSQRNSSYSLRAFARDLGLAVSTLTELLKGKYGLSRSRAQVVAQRLGLSPEQGEHFADLMAAKHARNAFEKQSAKSRVVERIGRDHQNLALDAFKLISDWYHFAILEMFSLTNFKEDPAWIGRRLGLRATVVRDALERMERLDLLERGPDGLRPTEDFSAVGNGGSVAAIRKFHTQILDKARNAIERQSVEEREYSSTIFSFARADLPAAKKAIQEFARAFSGKFVNEKEGDDVVCLSVQFFSLLEKES